jgi:hypothetical protein
VVRGFCEDSVQIDPNLFVPVGHALTRRHQLACMGMPLKCLQILDDHKSAFAFAGNAFACPSIATALLAFYLNAEGAWWH